MRPLGRTIFSILVLLISLGAIQEPQPSPRPKDLPSLEMTTAIACSRVDGLNNYVPLVPPQLTSEDKLKVYFRPLHFKVEPIKTRYRAKFAEDGRVRRKGEKTALSKEDKLLDYEMTFDSPDYQVYLTNTIGLKNLPPGEYEFDIILHDGLVEGSSATQTIAFTIIPTPKVEPTPEAQAAAKAETSPPTNEKKASKKGKPPRTSKPKS